MGSIIRKGKEGLGKPAGGGQFLKVGTDDAVAFAPMTGLDGMISIDQHEFWDVNPAVMVPCIHKNCPACALGNEPRFKAFLPVVTKEGEVKIYAFGIKVERQLEEIEAELGTLEGQMLKVRRSGSGKTTQYTVVPLGKKVKIDKSLLPDLEKVVGPTDAAAIKRLLEERGVTSSSDSSDEPPFDADEKKSDDWDEI